MGQSVLVFVSHSSDDKTSIIEPLVQDLEECFINIWIDKRKILPGDNLRKSIFRDGLDKADVVLIFFTESSLNSSWVDKEIKHVLREESKKGNDFDLRKIISMFDSESTYNEISTRYPELTDDLMYLLPMEYNKIHLGQIISAIWSKYFSLQGGSLETQKQLLSKDKEVLQRDKEIVQLREQLTKEKNRNNQTNLNDEFQRIMENGSINGFIQQKTMLLSNKNIILNNVHDATNALAFGLITHSKTAIGRLTLTDKGRDFFSWYTLNYK